MQRARIAASTTSMVCTADPLGLLRLFEPGVQLVRLERGSIPSLRAAARALAAYPGRRQCVIPIDSETERADPLAVDGLFPAGVLGGEREALSAELGAQVELFADLLGAEAVGARLVVGVEPHCPRFHVDRVMARGVCVLAGAPTELLEEAAVDRRWLGHAAGGLPDERSGLIRDASGIRRIEPFELAIFKGEGWPDNEGRGVVHRSPPSAEPRILWTLDAL